jgi:thiol-disulfide isomerase/thioredoxin
MNDRLFQRKISCLIAAFIIGGFFFVSLGKSQEFVSYTKVGDLIPSFSLTALEGAAFNIEGMKGKVVLVNFWATWCAPCLTEMPMLEKEVWQKYKGTDFSMMAIAREQGIQEIKAFQEKYKFTFQWDRIRKGRFIPNSPTQEFREIILSIARVGFFISLWETTPRILRN